MPDTVLTLAEQFARAAAKRDTEVLLRIVRAYGSMYTRLAGQIEALALQIGTGEMTTGQLARLGRFKSLLDQVDAELTGLQHFTRTELSLSAEEAVTRALKDSRSLISLSASQAGGITAGFNALQPAPVLRLLGFLSNNSRLYQRMSVMAGSHTEAFKQAFIDGVGLGWNPRKIVASMRKQLGGALTDALRMTRTAQLYAYREATRANYIVNQDTVTGWVWLAALNNPNTCIGCIRMHGTVHSNTETLNDHHNGRCTMVPIVKGYGNPITETGEQWFRRQSDADQIHFMGRDYHQAWKDGLYSFDQLSRETDNDVYGPMRTVTPLWQLLGAEPPLRTK